MYNNSYLWLSVWWTGQNHHTFLSCFPFNECAQCQAMATENDILSRHPWTIWMFQD